MTEIPSEEKASRPIGMAALFGFSPGSVLTSFFCTIYRPSCGFLWEQFFPGLYYCEYGVGSKLRSMGVIESDDMTISRKLMGKVSYSESFDIACKLLFSSVS